MTSPSAIIRDLSLARAVFQQRTILAVIGHHTGDRPMTAPTLQDTLRYHLRIDVNHEAGLIPAATRLQLTAAIRALDAAQARMEAVAREAYKRGSVMQYETGGTGTDEQLAAEIADIIAATDAQN
jgi:hypothetical protein